MAKVKFGDPFGMDQAQIKAIDWKLALKRISHDQRSDFIYAPHFSAIYSKATDDLVAAVCTKLKAGSYLPGTPISIEVPKSARLRTVGMNRLGANFSRPGSILWPTDRVLYQAMADQAASVIKKKSDRTRSFSHELADDNDPGMFLPTRQCWGKMQQALSRHSKAKSVQYIVKVDVANYFGSINQHTLINDLSESGFPSQLACRLEVMLTSYTQERSSRGIVQGMYPSDLIGNYYLKPIDRFLKEFPVRSARYVDDIYLFVSSMDEAEKLLRELIPRLRGYDLVLNESKSAIMPKGSLMSEEPDLEQMFEDALKEVAEKINEEELDVDYGFQSEWEDDEWDEEPDNTEDSDDIELIATKKLFDSIDQYPGNEENIERFCLPLFSISSSNHAVPHVLGAFKKRPSMSQIYASYLSDFLGDAAVSALLADLLSHDDLVDWQKMWIVAALLKTDEASDEAVLEANKLLSDANRHDALRAVCAVLIGKFGDYARRKALRHIYPTVSTYIQLAIYYSSRYWAAADKTNARATWGNSTPEHALLTIAMYGKPELK